MKILVLVKFVPESTAVIKVRPDGGGIETKGVKFLMNPFCEMAVEAALRAKEKVAGAEVTALTVGPAASVDALRTALAMGVDHAVHLCDDGFAGIDELTTARLIAKAIADRGFDLIFAGKIAIDYDSGQLGPALAELLDIPHVGAVQNIEWADDHQSLTARRRIEGAEEVVEVRLPCLLTAEKGLNEPRYPSLPKLMKAKKAPIETLDGAALGFAASDLAPDACPTRMGEFTPPPPRPPGRILEGTPEEAVKELVRILHEEEKLI
ncbi:MAG: electron transfer flavoprotein subunit beta/FixA family protein [Phycisphaerae bacterium]